MLKVGITGQGGFIGTHLFNTLRLYPKEFECVEFGKLFFDETALLDAFVAKCDVIVHLAAKNRHADPGTIYSVNVELTNKLIASLKRTSGKKHVIFASSTQEEKNNIYGDSKRECRRLLSGWAEENEGKMSGLIIPNVFGPFGNPYYNSVIATFCHQLINKEIPFIQVDAELKLIYVGELVNEIIKVIKDGKAVDKSYIKHSYEITVSGILELLKGYREQYLRQGNIPFLNNQFELNLFNTFRSYMDIEKTYPVKFVQHTDERGSFAEIIRLSNGGQISFSTTLPGITRGNHFHTRKIERFSVIKGKALIQLRKIGSNKVYNFNLSGDEPAYVDMPIWYAHNIKNTGDEELYTVFWINEFYDKDDSDTYIEVVNK